MRSETHFDEISFIDVWSFGILVYEIIAQLEPHHSADPINIARQIRDQGLVPTIPPACPQEIASLMQQCWQIDPARRPTMEHVLSLID
jgi:serine/threonine protein kinase